VTPTGEKQLWLVAGGNGAGKSTFHRLFLAPRGLPLVNADQIARALRPEAPQEASYDAVAQAELLRDSLLDRGASFCFETVFSHRSKIDFVARARALGYRIVIVFIHLGDPQLNLARVAQRVAAGGHRVPDEKILSRLPRTLANIEAALPLADEVIFIDNSSADDPLRVVARLSGGELTTKNKKAPHWVRAMLGNKAAGA
jgi:predicted ABC-type ATPase